MKEFAIKTWVKILAWLSAAVIVYLNIQLVVQEIQDWVGVSESDKILIYAIVVPIAIACLALLIYVFVHPLMSSHTQERKQLPHGVAEEFTIGPSISYNHIGIAIDFSGNDQKVIQSALKQGGKQASYTLIHVVESAAARYLKKNTEDHETKLDRENLIKYQRSLEELGYQTDSQIGFGTPARGISKIIAEQKIDLLVMGAHGHKGLKDLIFGTTVDAVRHQVKVPVLIIN